jgi:hypothetical protein
LNTRTSPEILDALADRRDRFRKTADFHHGLEVDILIEDVRDAAEALRIAEGFERVINLITEQTEEA